jgi:hypothetical protein
VTVLRVGYDRWSARPVYDYDVATRSLTLLKVQEIPRAMTPRSTIPRGWKSRRATARWCRSASSGARTAPGGPLHLYGYGAYGIAIGPGFSTTRLSLSIAASPMPSRISAAATIWAAPGTRRASWNSAPTPSTISSTWRRA